MHSRFTFSVVAVVAALTMTGCASTAAPPVDDAAPRASASAAAMASPAPTPSATWTLESLASKAGLVEFARSATPAPAALAWGKGALDGKPVKVYEFADEAAYVAFLQTVAGYGVSAANMVRFGNFAVAPDDQGQLDQIRAALG